MRFSIIKRVSSEGYVLVEKESGRNSSRYDLYLHEPFFWILVGDISFDHRGYKEAISPYFKSPMELLSYGIWAGVVEIKSQSIDGTMFNKIIESYKEDQKDGKVYNPTSPVHFE